MKKKKIVAGLLSAALVATSFLPAGGLFGLTSAQAATNTFSMKYASEYGKVEVSSVDLLDSNLFQKIVTVSDSSVKTTAEETAFKTKMNGATLLTHSAVAAVNSIVPTLDAKLLTESGIQSMKLELQALNGMPGTTKVDVRDASGTTLKTINVTVKTNRALISSAAIEFNQSANRLTASNIKYGYYGNDYTYQSSTTANPDANGAPTIDGKYVSAGAVTYLWFSVPKNATIKDIKTIAAANITKPSGSGMSFTLPRTAKNVNMAVVLTRSGLAKNSGIENAYVLSYGSVSYVNSTKSTTTTNGNTTTTTTTDANGNTTTTTTTTGGGSTTTTTTTTDATTGTTTTTTDTTNADGSTVKQTVVENADGSKTTTTVETAADGSVKETVVQENTDGTKVETVSETKADGTTIQSKTETAADGSSKSTKLTRRANGSAQKVISTVAANGASTVVTIEESKDGASEIINEVTDASGNTTAMDYTLPAGSNKLTLNTITTNAKTVKVPASIKIQAEVSLSKLSLKADTLSAEGKALKVTKIGKAALKGNKTATKLVIGKNVKSIGKQAFQGVSKLKTINIKGNVTTIGKNSFKNINKKATIKIKATAKQYKAMVKKIKNANKGNAPKKVTYKRVK